MKFNRALKLFTGTDNSAVFKQPSSPALLVLRCLVPSYLTINRITPITHVTPYVITLALLLSIIIAPLPGQADHHLPPNRVSDIQNTRHNFSATLIPVLPGDTQRNVEANSESDICIFCHTPHGSQDAEAPLWNRQLSNAAYTLYESSSMDAIPGQPTGTSKLCLSCHDGTIAIGAVNVLNGSYSLQDPSSEDISMAIPQGGPNMPPGLGNNTGFTRNLGIDLSNDHPISFQYDSSLAIDDGELRDPAVEPHIGNRSSRNIPDVPLENNEVQCNSCHDPHIRSTNADENIKFLRLNRLQRVEPATALFNRDNDIICLACHEKAGWVGSAHANEVVADEQYNLASATRNEFPVGTAVWQASCLGCHDNHAVEGSGRLLREGTDGMLSTDGAKLGGNVASEETCYLCHSSDGNTLTNQGFNSEVPDIKYAFNLPYRMPISNLDQTAGYETHDSGTANLPEAGKDLIESREALGHGNPLNRHAECTDCHNPHRATKNRHFADNPDVPDPAGTHEHGEPHSNIASGVLKGTWGIEPVYISDEFAVDPIDFDIKRGNPPINGLDNVSQPYVTREYQVCLKCHSNYSYITPPMLDSYSGGTPAGTNNVFRFTNQAMEFNSPVSHQGERTAVTPGGADINFSNNNHRSWHPVMRETGRSNLSRAISSANTMIYPFDNFVGSQTMYCSDCHGANISSSTSAPDGGENGVPRGPHGSENEFLLIGKWDSTTGTACNGINCNFEFRNDQQNDLCFKCHNRFAYANDNGNFRNNASGFSGPTGENWHLLHLDRLGRVKCNWCHVAVPHGWKNKGLLTNLNDVGQEVGLSPGTEVTLPVNQSGITQPYVNGPYYNGAVNKIVNFAISGQWQTSDCGSSSGQAGMQWMQTSCNNLP